MLPIELSATAAHRATEVRHAGAVVLAEVPRAGCANILAHVARVPTELGKVSEGVAAVDDEPLDGAVQPQAAAATAGVPCLWDQAAHMSVCKQREIHSKEQITHNNS